MGKGGKGGKGLSKSIGYIRQQQTQGNGIMGSGVFGNFGSIVKCEATDNSIFCTIMKLFNILIVMFILLSFIYLGYIAYKLLKKNRYKIL